MKKSFAVAFGGIVAAISLVLMLLTGLIPIGTYALPCIAGIFLAALVIENGYIWAVSVYIAVSAASFLFVADKEAALYYAAFLGLYPIVKGLIERIKIWALQYVIKLAVFNACMVSAFFIASVVLRLPADSYTLFGVYLPWVFLILGNIIFVIYDICVTRLIGLYVNVLRHTLFRR